MTSQRITCPHCHKSFPLTEALTHEVEEKLRGSLKKELQQQYRKEHDAELKRLIGERDAELREVKKQKETAEKRADQMYSKELVAQQRKHSLEVKQLQKQARDSRAATVKAQAQLKVMEKKLSQGSQQNQGEVVELELEDQLRRLFPMDDIEEVKKGQRGADVLHTVQTNRGAKCGSILWESKNTENWSEAWVTKLKKDLRARDAEIGVIVSEVLPPNYQNDWGHKDGVWITKPIHVASVAEVLRRWLVHIRSIRSSNASNSAQVEALKKYLVSPKFGRKVQALLENAIAMRTELESERTVTERRWQRRKQQIESLSEMTGLIYSDLQEILGEALPELPQLALQSGDDDL